MVSARSVIAQLKTLEDRAHEIGGHIRQWQDTAGVTVTEAFRPSKFTSRGDLAGLESPRHSRLWRMAD